MILSRISNQRIKYRVTDKQEHMPFFRFVPAYIVSYLYGSLPLVYLLGRQRGVNLKQSGSGNVGSANLLATGGGIKRATIGFLFDVSKGFLPVFICRKLGYPTKVAELAGVWGVIGQCWPIFLRLNGGRGLSTFIGVSLLINRRAWVISLVPMIGGSLWRISSSLRYPFQKSINQLESTRSKSTPFGCFLGILAFPLLCSLDHHRERKQQLAAMLLPFILLGRRLTAPLPDDTTHGPTRNKKAVLYRLIYDRNTSY